MKRYSFEVRGVPTPVLSIDSIVGEVRSRLDGVTEIPSEDFLDRLALEGISVTKSESERMAHSYDWWPVAIAWAHRGIVPTMPAGVVRPKNIAQVQSVLRMANEASIPLSPMGGRSGVSGGVVPLPNGIALDLTGLLGTDAEPGQAVVHVDETSCLADIPAGIFGPDLESGLGAIGQGFTLGHWPQSMDLSTFGGSLACRGAGQFSTRYGKIEDMVVGLNVVLATGKLISTEGKAPRSATGPNLSQLFIGSEGTLGVIVSARMRIHPKPHSNAKRAFSFSSFSEGLSVCRKIVQRGATPCVLRLYDEAETKRHFKLEDTCALVVFDESDSLLVDATMKIVDDECAKGTFQDTSLVDHWFERRNNVSELVPLWQAGIVVDTIEVAGSWGVLGQLVSEVISAMRGVDGTITASVHQSHAYVDGACLYFTFAGKNPSKDELSDEDQLLWQENYYAQVWKVATKAVTKLRAAISHHHGIGLNRSQFLEDALGSAFPTLQAIKDTLDPNNILNPG